MCAVLNNFLKTKFQDDKWGFGGCWEWRWERIASGLSARGVVTVSRERGRQAVVFEREGVSISQH